MDVLARTHELTVDAGWPAQRAPWQTRFSSLPAVPVTGDRRRISPIAIPVIGGRPIGGRHLVRAPWAEPLAAFAGVIVETQLVPDAWITPRSAARRAVDPPAALVGPPAVSLPAAAPRPYVVIPIVSDRGRVPVRVTPRPAPAPVAPARVDAWPAAPAAVPPAIVMSALGRPRASVPATAAAPIEPLVPSAVTSPPPPPRRCLLGRAVLLAAGFVMSLVAVEAAARLGRR